jgi:hypothetical protein
LLRIGKKRNETKRMRSVNNNSVETINAAATAIVSAETRVQPTAVPVSVCVYLSVGFVYDCVSSILFIFLCLVAEKMRKMERVINILDVLSCCFGCSMRNYFLLMIGFADFSPFFFFGVQLLFL